MPINRQEIANLKKQIATLRKRKRRWELRRDKLILKWRLDGEDLDWEYMRHALYGWEISSPQRTIDAYTTKLKELQRDPQ